MRIVFAGTPKFAAEQLYMEFLIFLKFLERSSSFDLILQNIFLVQQYLQVQLCRIDVV